MLLLAITYTHPAVSSLGDYVTWQGPYSGAWGQGASFSPWGVSLNSLDGFTFSDFIETRRVPEPSTLALLGIGLTGLGLIRRKRATR